MKRNSISAPSSIEERHEKGFNGLYIPWHVLQMFEQKKLKAIDMMMLCMVYSLCHKDRGCFASNTYLGKCVGVSENRASSIISKLRRLNLIIITAYDGRRRTLQVIYNMKPKELQQSAFQKQGVRLLKNRESEQISKQTPQKQGVRLLKNRESDSSKTGTDIRKIYSLERNQNHKSMSEPAASDQDTEVPLLPGEERQDAQLPEEDNKQFFRRKKQPSAFDIKAAEKFAEVVKSYRKVQKNSDLRQWANTFRQMREIDKVSEEDIRKVITWYRKYIGDDFVPEAFSAAAFRKKYAEGKFTSAMKRSKNGASLSNGRNRLTRENMWNDPENVLPGGILKKEIGQDGREYDGQLLYRIRRRILERFGQGLPLPKELQMVLDEEFPEVENITLSIIGRVG